MSNKPYKDFSPKWFDGDIPEKSYRSIFRWGDPKFNKFPKENLYKLMKNIFDLDDDYFSKYDVNL